MLKMCVGYIGLKVSDSVVSDSLRPHGLYHPWNSPDQNTGVGGYSLLHGIFPTQESNPGLPNCRQILYQLSHQGTWYVHVGLNKILKFVSPVSFLFGASLVKNPPANAGDIRDMGLIPGWGRSPRGGRGNPLQYSPGESHGQRSLAGYRP